MSKETRFCPFRRVLTRQRTRITENRAKSGLAAAAVSGTWRIVMAAACGSKRRRSRMDKQKIKSVPRLTTDNPVDNFQTALNFTDVSEDGWV